MEFVFDLTENPSIIMVSGKQLTGLREITVRTDMARGMKAITEKRIHLEATNAMQCHPYSSII